MDRRGFIYRSTGLLILSGVSVLGLVAQQPEEKKKYTLKGIIEKMTCNLLS